MSLLSRLGFVLALLILLPACQFKPDLDIEGDWSRYKALFVTPDGRVIDTGNGGVSHSEGQGYGLLLALKMNDKETFKQIWRWTKANLQIRNDHLFIWRRRPSVAVNEEDKNNASDGDILIAWSLLEASAKWRQMDYRQEAVQVINDIKEKLIVASNDLTLILPGEYGFQSPDASVVNLSYWVYPAFHAFAVYDKDPRWLRLISSGQTLMQKARFGFWQLPPDWLTISNNNQLQPFRNKRFGYDAIRIPIYLLWADMDSELLKPFANYWCFYRPFTPSWISLQENVMDSFGASSGIKAVKIVTLRAAGRVGQGRFSVIDKSQDYYSATLLLLSKLGYQQLADS
jgi:endoglucanase